MAVLNFPANPQINDTYSIGGKKWIFNGKAWVLDGTISFSSIIDKPTTLAGYGITDAISGVIGTINGGTGINAYSLGDIIYASGTNTLSKLQAGNTGNILSIVNGIPSWTNTITGDLTVGGDFTVNGETKIINSTVVTIADPILTLGGATAPTVDDDKDRGIDFRYHDGVSAKLGFFGWDDSEQVFTFIPDATNTNEVFSGLLGNAKFNIIYGNLAGGSTGSIFYQTDSNETATLNAGTEGQVLTLVDGLPTWQDPTGGGGTGNSTVTISLTPPQNPNPGDMWWDSGDGQLRVFYQDADSSQWVDATNATGDKGDKGDAATITIGTVNTVNSLTPASIINTGTSGDAIFNFNIPRGAQVSLGETSVLFPNQVPTLTNTASSGDLNLEFGIPRASNITVGTTSTFFPGTQASVSNSGENGDLILNFGIPRGSQVSVGTTTTVSSTQNASVTDTGTNGDVVLNFGIPVGKGITNIIDNLDGTITVFYGEDLSEIINLAGGIGGSGGASVTIDVTPPEEKEQGDLWWDSNIGQLKIWYEDDTGDGQWVDVVNNVNANGSGGGSSNVEISELAPSNPNVGDLWWDSNIGQLKIYYTDGDSFQWVDASNNVGVAGEDGSDSSIVIFSDTAPITPELGMLWYDSVNNILKVYKGEVLGWSSVSAQNNSTSTTTISISETAPNEPQPGNLWWDSSIGQLKIFYADNDTSQWVDASNNVGIPGQDGKAIISNTEPEDPFDGMIWFDTSVNIIKVYDDSDETWKATQSTGESLGGVIISDTEPSNPANGSLWYNSVDSTLNIYNDTTDSWIIVTGSNSGGGTSSSAITVSETAPLAPSVGSLWWDSVNGQLKIFYADVDNSQWVDASNNVGVAGQDGSDTSVAIISQTEPLNPVNGTLWYDSDENLLKIYQISTLSWLTLNPTQQQSSNEKVIISESAPSALNVIAGDLWWNSETGQLKIWYYDGTGVGQWVDASNNVGVAGKDGEESSVAVFSSMAPTNPVPGMLWYDSNDNVLKIYNDTTLSWNINALVSSAAIVNANAPANPVGGTLWYDTDEEALKVYDESFLEWISTKQSNVGTTISVSENPPLNPTNGSLWWDSNKGQLKIYYDYDESRTLNVSSSGASAYIIDGANNPNITLIRGSTYTFNINTTGHPFYITTAPGAYSESNEYTGEGLSDQGIDVGTVVFEVPVDLKISNLYYVCGFHSSMTGTFTLQDNPPGQWIDASNNVGVAGEDGSDSSTAIFSATAPDNPIGGMLWYDSVQNLLKIYNVNTASWSTVNPQQPINDGASIIVSENAPNEPQPGNLWWDSSIGQLKIFYADNDTSQWVDATNAAGIQGPQGIDGPRGGTIDDIIDNGDGTLTITYDSDETAVVQGAIGPAGTIQVGDVTSINPNQVPTITVVDEEGDPVTGPTSSAILNFEIPRPVVFSTGTITEVLPNEDPSITSSIDANGDITLDFDIPRAPAITIGTVEDRLSNQTAVVSTTIDEETGDIALNFGIPVGKSITKIEALDPEVAANTIRIFYGEIPPEDPNALYEDVTLESGASVEISDTPPITNLKAGNMWWDSASGKLKIYYVDGLDNAGQPTTVGQWVDAAGIGARGPAGPQGIPGPGVTNITQNGTTLTLSYGDSQTADFSFNGLFATQESVDLKAPIASPNFTGVIKVPAILEKSNVIAGAANSTPAIDLDTSAVWFFTGASTANWTINFRASSLVSLNDRMANGDSATVAVLVTNTGTPYRPTAFQIDGVSVTPRWQGGTAPTAGNANSVDIYTFSIMKTASATFSLFASQTRFA